jgi:membrane protease YdiL (CAAX protease family)
MDNRAPQSNLEQESTFSRPRALRDILIVGSPIVVLGAVGNVVGLSTLAGGAIVNLGYVLMIIFGGLILKGQSSGWREIGLGRPASWLKTALFGVGSFVAAVVVFVVMQTIAIGFLTALGLAPSEIDQSRFNQIEGNLPLFILMVILAWTTVAFGEELFYRAFLITRMIDFTTIGKGLAILIAGIIFGVVHFAEGPVGILSNGAFGVLFGWIYVRSGRNLWITIIGHGLINTLRFTLLYVGAA